MAENNPSDMAGQTPAKAKPAPKAGAKPAAPGGAKPAGKAAASKPAAQAAPAESGVYKPPVVRGETNPYKDSRIGALQLWFHERFYMLDPFFNKLKTKEVPLHRHSIWYYFGGLTLFFLILQVLTGILLLQYYKPTEAEAFHSFVFLQQHVPYGWLIRQIHAWSANAMILMAFVHMFSTFFMKAYRKPRELMWVSGFLLFVLSLGFGFTGYLLPWNELAYFATQVGTEVPKALPGGTFIVNILRGGPEVSGATLTRMFAMHVAILPAIVMVLLAAHLFLVQILGTSAPIGYKEAGLIKGYEKFFPDFLAKDMIGWLIAFVVLIYLSIISPWEIGAEANPLASAPNNIKPEWYFWGQFIMLKDFSFKGGEQLAIILFTLAGITWTLVPFLDKKASREERSPYFTMFGLFLCVTFIIYTFRVFLQYR